ncbi:hypothetical protein F441_19698 [Phytophthora nicotianae CJ01A1]|uniref:Uncharacterized protein n=2 Tax=Phytophthora nicotianae TaxID=4792 RepID=W2PJ05_PHYN3|nr:hypothetical protein PPTG_24187 [Phytophthora nicotianae INRA-310]ETN00827.1 hypothetical protein PPTG_24187 [Phytophthora nicotianae INRA-310]ETP03370.1 hypothetical protein F441_19698 [Phytophthora nicotianae CJ01A1]
MYARAKNREGAGCSSLSKPVKMFEAIQPNPSNNTQSFSFIDCWLHRWMLGASKQLPPGLPP